MKGTKSFCGEFCNYCCQNFVAIVFLQKLCDFKMDLIKWQLNWTSCHAIWVWNHTCDIKSNSRYALVRFWNHAYDFRPNCTPLSSITIIYHIWSKFGWVYDVITWLICIFKKLEYLWNEKRYLKTSLSLSLSLCGLHAYVLKSRKFEWCDFRHSTEHFEARKPD